MKIACNTVQLLKPTIVNQITNVRTISEVFLYYVRSKSLRVVKFQGSYLKGSYTYFDWIKWIEPLKPKILKIIIYQILISHTILRFLISTIITTFSTPFYNMVARW